MLLSPDWSVNYTERKLIKIIVDYNNPRQNCCDKLKNSFFFFYLELKKSLSPFPMLIKPLYIVYRKIRYTENNIDKGCGEIFGSL